MESTVQIKTYPDGRMDAENAAKYLGLSVGTLAAMRSNGKGQGPKYVKVGRKIFYFKKDLDAWILAGGKFLSTAQSLYFKNNTAPLKKLNSENLLRDKK